MIAAFIRRCWFEARGLAAVQIYLELPVGKPLPDFERRLLRGAVNLTLEDGGTPVDVGFRFYVAYTETSLSKGKSLSELKFGEATGKLWALRNQVRFYDEHIDALKRISSLPTSEVPA